MTPSTTRIALLSLLATAPFSSLDTSQHKYRADAARLRTPRPSGDDIDCADGERRRVLAGFHDGSYEVGNVNLTKKKNDGGTRPGPSQDVSRDFLGLDTLLSSSRIDDDFSNGVVFDVETASDSSVLRITHLEFYSSRIHYADGDADREESGASNAIDDVAVAVDYQVYTKEGTWLDALGDREYQLLSTGTMTLHQTNLDDNSNNNGSNNHNHKETLHNYTRHRIPLTNKIKLNGNGTRYSLYFGLSERILLHQRPLAISDNATPTKENSDHTPDHIPLLQTNDMNIYYGAATMIYPLAKATHPVFYRETRGFVGRIWYERDACVPSVTRWEECQKLKRPLSTEAMESVVEMGTVVYGGLKNEDGGGHKPSIDIVPSSPDAPTNDSNVAYLVITFGEAPLGTLMDESAQTSFERVLFDYYASLDVLSENEVDLNFVKMWYQQFLIKEKGNRQLRNSNNRNPQTFELSEYDDSSISPPGASLARYQVTVIISIMHTLLPDVITHDLLQNALNDNTSSFLKALKLTPSLTPYLQHMEYISSVVTIDELTSPPTRSPTFAPTILITEPIVVREPTPPYIIASILIGTIYACSMIFSTCYIKRARNEMEYDHGMKVLLQSTTMEDDIRRDTSPIETKEEMTIEKKRGIGSSWRASVKKLTARDAGKNGGNESHGDENESHSWERTSSAEDSSSSSSGEESSSDEPEELSIT
ncbi:hypothetical protein ACHAWX_005163 [Stephanocyclus meneghinianus]